MLKLPEENIGTTLQERHWGKQELSEQNTNSTRTGSNKQDQVSTDGPQEN